LRIGKLEHAEAILQPQQAQADEIAPEQADAYEIGRIVQEHLANAPIVAAQGLQYPDHLGPLQDQNQKGGHHIDPRHDDDDPDDQGNVEIKQGGPFKDPVIFGLDVLGIQSGQGLPIDFPALFPQLVKILQKHLKMADLVGLPAVHVLNVPDVHKDIAGIEFLKSTVVDPHDIKTPVVGDLGGVPTL